MNQRRRLKRIETECLRLMQAELRDLYTSLTASGSARLAASFIPWITDQREALPPWRPAEIVRMDEHRRSRVATHEG